MQVEPSSNNFGQLATANMIGHQILALVEYGQGSFAAKAFDDDGHFVRVMHANLLDILAAFEKRATFLE